MTKQIRSSEFINSTSKEYAIYVAENRAIPKVTDGLKSAQRKALWVLRNKSDKIKTIALSGELISSNLYVHGDASASEAISAMAGQYVNNIPLIQGIGHFGTKLIPNSYGAPRYTYVKRSKASQALMYPDIDIVPMMDNYDGSAKEPIHFLPIIPTVLLNGVSGIAVGWSTDILPHNIDDLIDGCIDVLQNKDVREIKPDFVNYKVDVNRIEDNSWEFTGLIDVVDSSTIRVLELPPDLNIEKFRDKLNSLEDEGKIKGYTDKSTDHINITIRFKRGEIKDWTNEKIIDFLKLRSRKTQRIIVIDWNNTGIRQYDTPEELVKDFVNWRLNWYRKRYENLLRIAEEDLNFFNALKECFDKKLPNKILTLKSKQEVRDEVEKITKKFKLNEDQTERLVSMPSYRWSTDYYDECLEKIKSLTQDIQEFNKILNDSKELKKIYKQELLELKKLKLA